MAEERKRYTPAGQAMSNVLKNFRETYRMQRDMKTGLWGSVREGFSSARGTWDTEKAPLRKERAMGLLPRREKETTTTTGGRAAAEAPPYEEAAYPAGREEQATEDQVNKRFRVVT